MRCVCSITKEAQANDTEETSRGFLNCCVLEFCSFKIHSQDVHHISRKKKVEDDPWHPISLDPTQVLSFLLNIMGSTVPSEDVPN